jgi:putative methyltransferase (TIGR04325 family)
MIGNMLTQLKPVIKELIPPIVLKAYNRIRNGRYGLFGNYTSWEAAMKDSVGYDSDVILNKVRDSLLKVKEGKAIGDQDSCLFDKIQYSWPVLAGLLRIASIKGNKLSVLDFGGSLGSYYYQLKDFLSDLDELRWSIVEQEKFVRCGQELFENNQLKFYYAIETCLEHEDPDVILLSGVIQYLSDPYTFLGNLIKYNFEYIIFDRTPFIQGCQERLTVQKVHPYIYEASYPAYFFNEDKFLNYLEKSYDLLVEFESQDKVNIPSQFKGFIFKKQQ